MEFAIAGKTPSESLRGKENEKGVEEARELDENGKGRSCLACSAIASRRGTRRSAESTERKLGERELGFESI